jgi:hypothetical protein
VYIAMRKLSTVDAANNFSTFLRVPSRDILGRMRWFVQVPKDSFAFLMDADFVPVKDFAEKLKTGTPGALLRYAADAWNKRSERHAVIIPAFQWEAEGAERVEQETQVCAPSVQDIRPESDCWMFSRYDVPLNKAALQRMLKNGSIEGFYERKVSTIDHGCFWSHRHVQLLQTQLSRCSSSSQLLQKCLFSPFGFSFSYLSLAIGVFMIV